MKKLILLFVALFAAFISTEALAQNCGMKNPAFGEKRERADRMMEKILGRATKFTSDTTIWEEKQPGGIEVIHKAKYDKNNKFYLYTVTRIVPGTKGGADDIIDVFTNLEQALEKHGFMRSGSPEKGSFKQITYVNQHYICRENSSIAADLTLAKNLDSSLLSVSTSTYLDN